MCSSLDKSVLIALLKCTGREQAMTAPQLEQMLYIPERTVREIISRNYQAWGVHGVLVCEPGFGFYFSTEAEEVQREWLRKRQLRDEAGKRLAVLEAVMNDNGFGALCRQVKRGGAEARREA